MKLPTKLVLCGLLLSATAACNAHGPHGHHAKADCYFDKIDTNGNGFISHSEMSKHAHKKLHKADTNGDRMVSREEFREMKRRKSHHHKYCGHKYADHKHTYPNSHHTNYNYNNHHH